MPELSISFHVKFSFLFLISHFAYCMHTVGAQEEFQHANNVINASMIEECYYM